MKKVVEPRIIWSLAWAIAIIASAFIFNGKPSSNWIEASLIGLALVFVVLKPMSTGCVR